MPWPKLFDKGFRYLLLLAVLLLQRTLTYFIRWSMTVWLTSSLISLDLAKQLNLKIVWVQQNSSIPTSQIGGNPYNDTSPYEVSECSMLLTHISRSACSRRLSSDSAFANLFVWEHFDLEIEFQIQINVLFAQANRHFQIWAVNRRRENLLSREARFNTKPKSILLSILLWLPLLLLLLNSSHL